MGTKVKGGRKLRRTGIHKAQYTRQFLRTAANKTRRATKRRKRAEFWAAKKPETAKPVIPTSEIGLPSS